MVRYHYALVDDLISREEFDRRIEQKIQACGNLADETAAALLVVRDLDRSHVSIRGLRGRSSLFCFYAKIIAFSEAKEFDRPDGSKGLVARLTVADETGQIDLVLWDEQAAAVRESFEIGEVIEVIGRHGRNQREIMPLNMRKTHVEISCDMTPREVRPPERRDTPLLIISLQPAKPYTRRDGTGGEMISGVVGDSGGTARLLCWDAGMLAGITPGMAVHAAGVLEKEGDRGGREIVIDETTILTLADEAPEIPFTPLANLPVDQMVSVSGSLVQVTPPRSFTRRDGTGSQVRNVRISDGTTTVPVVIWDEQAGNPLLPGERVIIYHARVRIGRSGDTELSIGRTGTVMVVPDEDQEEITIEGTIIRTREGMVIDDGERAFLVGNDLPEGAGLLITGIASRRRLYYTATQRIFRDPGEVRERLSAFLRPADG